MLTLIHYIILTDTTFDFYNVFVNAEININFNINKCFRRIIHC